MIRKTIGIIPRNLIKNKKRTISIAVSIILSIILITSVEILIRSAVKAVIENNARVTGEYHAAYRNVRKKYLDILGQNEKVSRIGTTALVGYGKYNEYEMEINGIDQEAIDLLNLELLEGSFPKDKNDIVIEKWILEKVYPGKKVGDKIIVPCGIFKRSAGKIEDIKNMEFTLSGVMENLMGTRSVNQGKAYLSLEGAENIIGSEEILYKQYFTVKDSYPIESATQDFDMEYENKRFGDYEINDRYVALLNTGEKSKHVVIIIDIIIAFAASVMIYNIFNISIVERLKQFGLLRSIGITPLQIKGLVIGEGIALGVIFIPFGIAAGVNIVKL
jgi:ABC-type lipoprotein release transport system permease subunit